MLFDCDCNGLLFLKRFVHDLVRSTSNSYDKHLGAEKFTDLFNERDESQGRDLILLVRLQGFLTRFLFFHAGQRRYYPSY